MLRRLLVLIAFSASKSSSAQEIIVEKSIGWKGNAVQLNTIRNTEGNLHATILSNNDSFRIFLMGNQDTIEKEISLKRQNKEEIRGGFIAQRKIYIFCGNILPRGLHNYIIDMDGGMISQHFVPSKISNDEVIDRASAGNCYMVFSLDKKTSEFIVSKWKNPDSAHVTRFPVHEGNIWNDLTVGSGFSRELQITKVDEAGLPDLSIVGNRRKLYIKHDSIFLLLNNNDGKTKVFVFDTKANTMSVREMDQGSGQQWTNQNSSENSYLLDGKLYFVSATVDLLYISVSDFYTGKVLKDFTVAREDTISFKNTPIMQDGSLGLKELTKTRQLLRKMVKAKAVIAALNDSLGISLIIGSNKEMSSGGGGGGGSFMNAAGPPGYTVYVPTGGFSSGSWTKSVRFRMQLDSVSLNHLPGEMESSINDRIDDYTKDIKKPLNGENLFFQNGKYVYIYYDSGKRGLDFMHFNY